MNSISSLIVITALLILNNIGFSQSTKSYNKAVKKTEKIDNEIKTENPALALSESQKEQIIALQKELMDVVLAYEVNNSSKVEVKTKTKELSKAMNSKIRSNVFTEEQAKVHKASRKKMKARKGKRSPKAKKTSKKSNNKKNRNPAKTITTAEADEIYAEATAKQKASAEEATGKLNAKIIASDASLALSDDQRKQICALKLKPLFVAEKMKEEGLTKDEIKVENEEIVKSSKQLIRSILTKEQEEARKKYQ